MDGGGGVVCCRSEAMEDIDACRRRPVGRMRLSVLYDGARLVIGPHLPAFLRRYPEVQVDITVDDRMVDIVAEGFDAGIRYGGSVPEDYVERQSTCLISSPVAFTRMPSFV